MDGQYNLRSPAVKRLMKEAQELRQPTEQYFTQPLEDNLFEWHFTIRGPADSAFEGGIYHGRIVLPPDYPMKPPSIILLTPNGRFETNKKICLSISGHHPESWQPSWSIRTALLAIIGFMPTHGSGAIGSLDYTPAERKVYAKKSLEWKCPQCGAVTTMLLPVTEASKETTKEAEALASQIAFQGEKDKSAGDTSDASDTPPTSQTTPPDPIVAPPTSSPAAATNAPPVPPTSPFANMPQFNTNMYRMPFPAPGMSPPGYPGMAPPGYPGVSPPGYPGVRPPTTEAQRSPFPAGAGNLMYWPYSNNHVRPAVDDARTTVDAAPSTGNDTNPTVTAPTVAPLSPPAATVTTQSPTPVTSSSSSNTTPTTTTPTTTTPTTTTPTTTTGVRQRARTVTRAPTLIGQTAELPPVRSAKDGDRILLILTVIVGVLLMALVLRRLLKVANVF